VFGFCVVDEVHKPSGRKKRGKHRANERIGGSTSELCWRGLRRTGEQSVAERVLSTSLERGSLAWANDPVEPRS
jgi:hypothetical protein